MKLSKIKTWGISELIEHLTWAFVAYLIGIIISYDWNINLYFIGGFIFVFGIIYLWKRKNLIFSWISIVCFFLVSVSWHRANFIDIFGWIITVVVRGFVWIALAANG